MSNLLVPRSALPALKAVKQGGNPGFAIAQRDRLIEALERELNAIKAKHAPRLRKGADGQPTLRSAARVVGSKSDPLAVRAAWQSLSVLACETPEYKALRLATMFAEGATSEADWRRIALETQPMRFECGPSQFALEAGGSETVPLFGE